MRSTATRRLLLLLLLILPSVSHAGDRSSLEYWKGYDNTVSSELSRRAQAVFRRVLSASDRRAGVEPALYIVNYDGSPWAQTLPDGSIILTVNGLNFCYANQRLEDGDSRLAFVIGHELAHLYNGDFWPHEYFRMIREKREKVEAGIDSIRGAGDVRRHAVKHETLISKELKADQYGIIYAVMAGYDSDRIISRDGNFFIEWAEKRYPFRNIPADLLRLSQKRSDAVTIRLREVSDKAALFHLGVISYHLRRFDDAAALFSRFASYFPSREVYSNIGTIYLRRAYEHFLSSRTPESFPFLLSFGIDPETSAERIEIGREFREERFREYKRLAGLAVRDLKKASAYDPFYIEAKNNLGCAYIMDDRLYDAVSVLEEALKLTPGSRRVQNNLAVAYILLGQRIESRALIAKAEELLAEAASEERNAVSNLDALLLLEGRRGSMPEEGGFFEAPLTERLIQFSPDERYSPGIKAAEGPGILLTERIAGRDGSVIKILKVRGRDILLLTIDDHIQLSLYLRPSGLFTGISGDGDRRVYISGRSKKGLLLTNNKEPNYFEF